MHIALAVPSLPSPVVSPYQAKKTSLSQTPEVHAGCGRLHARRSLVAATAIPWMKVREVPKEQEDLDKRTNKRRTGNGSVPRTLRCDHRCCGVFPFVLPCDSDLCWLPFTHLDFLHLTLPSSSIPDATVDLGILTPCLFTTASPWWSLHHSNTMTGSLLTWVRVAAVAALAQQVTPQTCCAFQSHTSPQE